MYIILLNISNRYIGKSKNKYIALNTNYLRKSNFWINTDSKRSVKYLYPSFEIFIQAASALTAGSLGFCGSQKEHAKIWNIFIWLTFYHNYWVNNSIILGVWNTLQCTEVILFKIIGVVTAPQKSRVPMKHMHYPISTKAISVLVAHPLFPNLR